MNEQMKPNPEAVEVDNELWQGRADSIAGRLDSSDKSVYITGQVNSVIKSLRNTISGPTDPEYGRLLSELAKIEPNWTDQIFKNFGSLLLALAWDSESGLDSVLFLQYADKAAGLLPSLRPQLSVLLAGNAEEPNLKTLLIGLFMHDKLTYPIEVVQKVMRVLQEPIMAPRS